VLRGKAGLVLPAARAGEAGDAVAAVVLLPLV
jgi:hypothetical protein